MGKRKNLASQVSVSSAQDPPPESSKSPQVPTGATYGATLFGFLIVVLYFIVHMFLGKPSWEKSAEFLNIVQKAFDPPPLLFEHHVVNFSEGILTKVRKRL